MMTTDMAKVRVVKNLIRAAVHEALKHGSTCSCELCVAVRVVQAIPRPCPNAHLGGVRE